MKTFYGDAYYLDQTGKWRYVANNASVPDSATFIDARGEFHMCAPELLADVMLDSRMLSELLNVKHKTIAQMLMRNDLPAPQVRRGKTPFWSRPVIDIWRAGRPGKGAHLRKSNAA